MGFGLEIKRLREDANISAQKLADKVGIDAARLRKWEEKDMSPREEDTAIIEAFFKMSLDELSKQKSIKKFLIVPIETGGLNGSGGADGQHEVKKITVDADLEQELGRINERLLRAEATLEVYESAIAEVLSDPKKKGDFSQKIDALRDAVSKAVNRRFDELKRKQRP